MKLKFRKVKSDGIITFKTIITMDEEEAGGIRRIMDHDNFDPEQYRPEGLDEFEKLVSFSHWIKEMSFFAMLWENRLNQQVIPVIKACTDRKKSRPPSTRKRRKRK